MGGRPVLDLSVGDALLTLPIVKRNVVRAVAVHARDLTVKVFVHLRTLP